MTKFKFLLFAGALAGFVSLAYAGFDDGKAAYDKVTMSRLLKSSNL